MLARKSGIPIVALQGVRSAPPSVSNSTRSYTSSISDNGCINSTRGGKPGGDGTRQHRKEQDVGRSRRGYATIAEGGEAARNARHDRHNNHNVPEHHWPEPLAGKSCPTPYQIFDLKKTAAYNKARYYELVKIYHPDRDSLTENNNGSVQADLLKLERYRLIVAAHVILSDPGKRSAYDRFGAGWDGKAEIGGKHDPSRSSGGGGHQPGPFSQNSNEASSNIWRNATWEDWERWRTDYASDPRPQAPVYLKNTYFFAFLGLLSVVASSMQFKRGQEATAFVHEQRDKVHERTAQDLQKTKAEVFARGRDERVEWFMRNREAAIDQGQFGAAGIEKLREEKADRLLPNKEICRSEEVAGSGV